MSVSVGMVCRGDSRSERRGLCLVFIVCQMGRSEREDGTLISGVSVILVVRSLGGVVEDVSISLVAIMILLCLASLRSS